MAEKEKKVGRRYLMPYGDGEIALFSTGVLASRLKRKNQSVNRMVEVGIVPETPFKRPRKGSVPFRLWTKGQIEAVSAVLTSLGIKRVVPHRRRTEVRDAISVKWREQGIPLGEEVLCTNAVPV